MTVWINRRHIPDTDPKAREIAEQPLSKEGGFQLIFRDRYLMLMAALVVLLNIVNTSGEFLLGKLVVAEARGHSPEPPWRPRARDSSASSTARSSGG